MIKKLLIISITLLGFMAFSDESKHHSHTSQMGGMQMGNMEENSSKVEKPSAPEMEMHRKAIPNGEAMEAMPQILPKRIYTVTGQEDFDAIMGYGREDGMVGMMNLMMVEGSDMEGMEMEPMHSHGPTSDLDPLASENIAKFSKNSQGTAPHHETAISSKRLSINKAEIKPNPPIVGENKIVFSVSMQGTGQNVSGAKLKTHVEMPSMDMGSEEPLIKELGGGKYEVVVRFTMAGPWKVKIEGSEKSGGEISSELVFEAGAKESWVQTR